MQDFANSALRDPQASNPELSGGTNVGSDTDAAQVAAQSRLLTPTERRIAALVARGRTNREVADALQLSPRTVEWNLTKVYRVLNVRSRTELAAIWPRERDDLATTDLP